MTVQYTTTAESDVERILKIGQHLPRLGYGKNQVSCFFLLTGYFIREWQDITYLC